MKIIEPLAAGVSPDTEAVLKLQGIPADAVVQDRLRHLVETARELFARLAEPRGIYQEVTIAEFETIYEGEGLNGHPTPLEEIFPDADRLALFCVTLGEPVSHKVTELFNGNDPALGYSLDAIASDRADHAAEIVGRRFRDDLLQDDGLKPSARVLTYSPGYCGWHVSGQRKLFAALQPERIGVHLNSSYLMQPLKSVSGVLVAGPPDIHDFDDDFDFCQDCWTRQCRERISAVLEPVDEPEEGSEWRS